MFEHMSSVDLLAWAGSQLIVAAAIWGGIKADIRSLHNEIESAQKAADTAHKRIDSILLDASRS